MDHWVIGAAAAAGYISKYWKNISKDKDSLSGMSSEACKNEEQENLTCPLHRLAKQKKIVEDASTNVRRKISNERFSQLGCASEAKVVSNSENGEKLGHLGNFEDCHVLDLASIQPGFSTKEKLNESGTRNGVERPSSHFTREIDSSCGWRPRSSLRAKLSYGQFMKPLSSLESCLMAQLYKEHMKMEEYVLRTLPPPLTTIRPLLVTDGTHIISRANTCSFRTHNGPDDDRPDKEDSVCGISQLPKLDLYKRKQMKTRRQHNERLSSYQKLGRGDHIHSQKGAHDGRVLFCLGLSVGIISSLISNRREVNKLKELLRQTEALVQDLQEELEMKDSLAVRELRSENHESLGTSESPFHNNVPKQLFPVQKGDLTNNCGKESYSEKAEDSSESMSKIEAELEAELERLGLNMNTNSLERKLSNLVALDTDFAPDFAQGELRADKVNRQAVAHNESDGDRSGTFTPHPANYAVSPRELSLRLHEVIQSRLEERVKELETALENRRRKVQFMESEHKNICQKLSSTGLRYSSGEDSPVAEVDCSYMTHPLVMNLSGEALDAYNEAYEELTKVDELEEDDSPEVVFEKNNDIGLHTCDQSLQRVPDGGTNLLLSHLIHHEAERLQGASNGELKTPLEHGLIQESVSGDISEDENSDCHDEMEKRLIEQILEKTRKGSPVLLNAQRLLLSTDENEH